MKSKRFGKKTMTAQIDSIRQLVKVTIRRKHPKTVSELLQILQEDHPTVTKENVVDIIKKLKEDGEIELELSPPRAGNYLQFLQARLQNTWFYLVVAASIATLAAVYIIPNTYPAVVFRWIMGSIFILFLPGYVTIQALFPTEKELDNIERFVLSIGLSIAITPLIGLLLNYTPWGIRLDPVMTSLSLFTLGVAAAATYRRYKIALTNSLKGKQP